MHCCWQPPLATEHSSTSVRQTQSCKPDFFQHQDFMQHQMFQRINVTHWLTIFVKKWIIRCDKVCSACYSMPVNGNHNNIIIIWPHHRRNFVCDGGDLSPPFFSKWNLQFFKFGQENRIFLAIRSVLWPKTCRKCDSGRGSAPDPAGGAQDALPDPLVSWGGDTPPHTRPHSAPLALRSSCPLTPNPGDATGHRDFLR